MGAECCIVAENKPSQFDNIANGAANKYFEDSSFPQDRIFQDKIDEIMKRKGNEDFLSRRIMKKNRVKDEYYLGDWDVAGYRKGYGILYRPGEMLYEGNFDSVPHGQGVLDDLKNELIYQGEFSHGKAEGKCKLTKRNGLYSFEGVIGSDAKPIAGILTVNSPSDASILYRVHLNNYPENKARIEFADGGKYQGFINFNTFQPQGQGLYEYINGATYDGGWLDGQFHGKGRFTWKNGSSYEGDYVAGNKHGYGRFTYPSKKLYEGGWANGKQEGKGKLYNLAHQLIKEGVWKNGEFQQ